MKEDPHFVLALISNALSSGLTCSQWKGSDAIKAFDFKKIISVSYLASRKHSRWP